MWRVPWVVAWASEWASEWGWVSAWGLASERDRVVGVDTESVANVGGGIGYRRMFHTAERMSTRTMTWLVIAVVVSSRSRARILMDQEIKFTMSYTVDDHVFLDGLGRAPIGWLSDCSSSDHSTNERGRARAGRRQ